MGAEKSPTFSVGLRFIVTRLLSLVTRLISLEIKDVEQAYNFLVLNFYLSILINCSEVIFYF